MTVKYEYKSTCCGHEYMEMRAADEPMFFTVCNKCKNANYELVNETVLSETVERAAPDVVVEETPAE
jgi:hypothetical protein